MASPKLRRVLTLVPKLVSEGRRVAVVSKWSTILSVLALCLTQRKILFVRIDDAVRVGRNGHQMAPEAKEQLIHRLESVRWNSGCS